MSLGLWLGHLGVGSFNSSLLSALNPITSQGPGFPALMSPLQSSPQCDRWGGGESGSLLVGSQGYHLPQL